MNTLSVRPLEGAGLLSLQSADLNLVLCAVAVLMGLFCYEHKRQLKKFKKVWKEKLDTSLMAVREAQRKRIDDFKVQPCAMKAEWAALKVDVEKRIEELRSLKSDVNGQLTSLKVEFQLQMSKFPRSPDKLSLPFLAPKTQRAFDLQLELLAKKVDEKLVSSNEQSTLLLLDTVNKLEERISAMEVNTQREPRLPNGHCD